ncbi:LCP family protein [Streptacidiphilus sp. EB103A]|uniref:LCP family protein n=1 Tax=Streptacidiphilus sp. EB103A TaxID=3156275 RepID=UPI0035132CDA
MTGRSAGRRDRGPAPVPGGRAAARKGRKGGRRKALKITALATGGLLVVGAGGAYYEYQKLNGNLTTAALTQSNNPTSAGTEKPDAFGRTPINILVMGSDGRLTAADCKLGGDCGSGGGERADVEMVVHISADRSSATVMSIPRDLETALPACTDSANNTSVGTRTDMINSALNYGPSCQVAAVHQLTGIPIDHFVKLTFSGVVTMSDAVGGVNLCVSNNIYDPDSHLKLAKGAHTLKGVAALEFVRTRHGFGDGSDLGRTYAQHLFLSSMISKMKSAGTLTDPVAVLNLANAATKALTVDTGLGSVVKLTSLALDLSKVPTSRITFTTMQTQPDPTNSARVVIAPGAQTLFDTIANDQSLTAGASTSTSTASSTAGASASAAATTAAAVDTGSVAVKVENGTGITGRAGAVANSLISKGYSKQTSAVTGNAATSTTLTYPAGKSAEAQAVAKTLGLKSSALKQGSGSGIVLTIGTDWKSGVTFPGSTTTPSTANTKAALNNAHAQTANDTKGCAQVSTYNDVVTLPGYGSMSPSRAYALSPTVADSAP